MVGRLRLIDGSNYEGKSFGGINSVSGEVVFATGMVGYPQSLTDPSFKGQILVYTYPLIGNYGVPEKKYWESDKLQIAGLIVCNYINKPSHYTSVQTLSQWLKKENIPALEIKDTRGITLKLRQKGVMLGKVLIGNNKQELNFTDPNLRNLVAEVSVKKPVVYGKGKKTVALVDCGAKRNIINSLVKRNLKVIVLPWDFSPLALKNKISGVALSNGPGDPTKAVKTIENVKKVLDKKLPILGICLGNQLLALASGGKTFKLKYGHRSQNQPAVLRGTKQCFLTTQNHGYAVGKIPKGFKEWFYNANDKTNEGIIHAKLPFMSVQFHPEATPGPKDTDWIFDEFIKKLK